MTALSRLSVLPLAVALVLPLLPSKAEAYPLNPWGSIIPEKNISINPYLYVYPGPGVSPLFYAGYGFSEKVDMWAGVGMNLGFNPTAASLGTLEIFPRYFITPELAVAPHLYFTPGASLQVAPEVHYVKALDKFTLTVNAGYRPTFDLSGAGGVSHDLALIVAPELAINDRLSIYLEGDLYQSLSGGGTSVGLLPGVWFALDEEAVHSISVAVNIPLPFDSDALYVGAWYSTSFDLSGE